MPADFDDKSYWAHRFSSETAFEWLVSSETFIAAMEPRLAGLDKETARILHLGSGTSDLANHFRARGFQRVTNADYEPLALERGRELEREAFGDVQMDYVVADATRLGLDLREEFDLVVDKSTSDAISCGGESPLSRMASSISRVLADGGLWISMSYSSSRFELRHLPFQVEVIAKMPAAKLKATDPDIYHFCYLLRPKPI